MNFWLMKSEGDCYSIDHLKKDRTSPWSGVRNFQARNFMRDDMKIGDMILFYHSNAKPSGVYGIAKVASRSHADLSALDEKDEHYDPRSTTEKPIWECVDVMFVKKLVRPISLEEIKNDLELAGMLVAKKGSRLSIQPVLQKHFERVLALGEMK